MKVSDIRFLGRNDLQEAARLSDLIFRDADQTSMGEAFPPIFSGNYRSSVGVFEDGKLVSFIGLVPGFIQVGSAQLPIFSIGSVCTHPDYRGHGYAGELLERVFRHIEASDGSLLFISGDRSLYTRNGCHHFGQARKYVLSSATDGQGHAASHTDITVREALEKDRFRVQALSERSAVRHQRSMFETAELMQAEALAGIYKLKHELVVAESEGTVAAYAIVAVPGHIPTEAVPFVVEWGGDARMAAQLFSHAIAAYNLTKLEVTVPWQDKELQEALEPLTYTNVRNSGTVKLVNSQRFWEQIAPYLADINKEVLEQLALSNVNGEDGAADLTIAGETFRLSTDKLISLLFDAEPALFEADEHQLAMLQKLFPIPLPYTAGLNFI